jgi:hypothetical protein
MGEIQKLPPCGNWPVDNRINWLKSRDRISGRLSHVFVLPTTPLGASQLSHVTKDRCCNFESCRAPLTENCKAKAEFSCGPGSGTISRLVGILRCPCVARQHSRRSRTRESTMMWPTVEPSWVVCCYRTSSQNIPARFCAKAKIHAQSDASGPHSAALSVSINSPSEETPQSDGLPDIRVRRAIFFCVGGRGTISCILGPSST